MSDLGSTIDFQPSDERLLSPSATERLSGLLAGLDRLDPILALPDYPAMLEAGHEFAGYRMRSRLGAGRFGVVLLADDPILKRQVIVKVPQPAVLADPNLRERFSREARASARLEHPGIVSVFDAGDVGGLPFLAAAFVSGPTLREWRRKHPEPVPTQIAARFMNVVALAVQHAHERGVLHCDLAPSNVLLQPLDGQERNANWLSAFTPLVTDFGLARLIDEDPALTQTFQVAGTPFYMAPEQARGDRRNLTSQTDVYALGAILYDLLVGTPPFVGTATMTVVAQLQVELPEPPRKCRPSVHRDLEAICLKCLEKAPQDRYVSARALAEDLERFLSGRPVVARPVQQFVRAARWAARNAIVAGVLSIALIATALAIGVAVDRWFKENQSRADSAVNEAEKNIARAQVKVAEAGRKTAELYAALERIRQRRLARAAGWAAENRTDLVRICSHRSVDESVALRTEAAAVAGAIDLGTPRAVAIGFHSQDVAFDPTGQVLAIGSFSPNLLGIITVRLINLATEADVRSLLVTADRRWESRAGGRQDGCWAMAFSSDGKHFAAGTRSGWIVIWDLSRPDSNPLARWRHSPPTEGGPLNAKNERITQLVFDHAGRLWSGDDATTAAWDPGHDWAESERHQGSFCRPTAGSIGHPMRVFEKAMTAIHPTGRFHIRQQTDQELLVCSPDDHPVGRLALPDDDRADDNTITDFVVSPDGEMVLATAEHAGHLKLWDLVGSRLLAARTMLSGSLRTVFHPDGQSIAVVESDRVLIFEISRTTAVESLGIQPCPLDDVDLTPDGRFLATLGTLTNRSGIMSLQVHDLARPVLDRETFVRQLPSPIGNSRKRLAISSDGHEVVTHRHDSFVSFRLPDVSGNLLDGTQATRDIRFSRSGKLWAVGSNAVFAWRELTDKPVRSTGSVSSLSVGNDEALVGRNDGTLARYSAAGNLLRVDLIANSAITGLAHDAGRIIAGTAAGGILILNGERIMLTIPQAHADTIWAVAIGPDGWFATGSGDRQVRVWDAQGQVMFALLQTRPVRRLFWIDGGRTLVILSEGERGVRRWHLDTLKSEFRRIGIAPCLPEMR